MQEYNQNHLPIPVKITKILRQILAENIENEVRILAILEAINSLNKTKK